MRNSIASYKESLSRIASDVQDAAEELEISSSRMGEDAAVSDRRISHRFAQSTSPTGSPIVNGFDRGSRDEIEQHKAEIQRLQASEAEIKVLAVNYAAILKEKEEQLSRLHEENSSLRKSLDVKTAVAPVSKDEILKISTNNSITVKTADRSPNRQHRYTGQINSRSPGINGQKSIISKQDMSSNGGNQVDWIQRKMDPRVPNSHGNDKDLPSLHEENNRALAMQATHESEIKQLTVQLESECKNAANTERKFQEEQKQNKTFQREIDHLKVEKERTSSEMKELHRELSAKLSEVRQLQSELNRKGESDESLERLKNAVLALEKENSNLKMEKDKLEAALKLNAEWRLEKSEASPETQVKNSSNSAELKVGEMTTRILHMEKTLEVTRKERDKALQELTRLKQHLLDKELEESDKMDEDNKLIEELRANSEYQRSHILQLEKALRQEKAKHEETKKTKIDELQTSNEVINGLKHKLANYMSTMEAKNVELLNLQTALGQYYAETEAKERSERDLGSAREELVKLSESLKIANQQLEISKKEKDEILLKLSQVERMLSEGKLTVQKLQDDNSKLRRTLEQSMTRINRMSIDSDYYVDRRIVIKLLVAYFQRNHSKEVMDLMVRMLGFSDEDKQRIGFAQQVAGKGVVRGVLGLPGRLVGGILRGSSPGASSHAPSENQSFADLWVDFLLKETEERERREMVEASKASSSTQERSTTTTTMPSGPEYKSGMLDSASSFATVQSSANPIASPFPSNHNHLFEHSNSEFATVPLTSSISPPPEPSYRFSRPPPRF